MALGRAILAMVSLLGALACGDDDPLRQDTADAGAGSRADAGDDLANRPACRACADQLTVAADRCGADTRRCIDDPTLALEAQLACFDADGRCYDGALRTAAACHEGCGDPEQADVERCTGQCFLERARCAQAALRRADGCFDTCSPATCDLCRARGELDFDACNDAAEGCAASCVRTHRPGG
jgi:hypothetical protein